MSPIYRLLMDFVHASREARAATHPTRRAAAELRLDRASRAMQIIARNR